MQVKLVTIGNSEIGTVSLQRNDTIAALKKALNNLNNVPVKPERQAFRAEPRGKNLSDSVTLGSLSENSSITIYVKDLGPQIKWKTVFLAEYAGPLFVYLLVFTRPGILYKAQDAEFSFAAKLACLCWSIHYLKRILETLFVHRFSHATMPLRNLFKNCSYYWLFTLYVAYYACHPLYMPPNILQTLVGFVIFCFAELGNLSIHLALRNLRPPGTSVRKIPTATGNPFTALFNYVSCPNYTYEFLSWAGFTIMTQCVPAGLFSLAGLYQMTVWAIGKHKLYKKEFANYPKNRKAIIPFLI